MPISRHRIKYSKLGIFTTRISRIKQVAISRRPLLKKMKKIFLHLLLQLSKIIHLGESKPTAIVHTSHRSINTLKIHKTVQ